MPSPDIAALMTRGVVTYSVGCAGTPQIEPGSELNQSEVKSRYLKDFDGTLSAIHPLGTPSFCLSQVCLLHTYLYVHPGLSGYENENIIFQLFSCKA